VGALGPAARLSLSRKSLFESLLGLLAAADIKESGRGANRVSSFVTERDDVNVYPGSAPVLAHVASLGFILSLTAAPPRINGGSLRPLCWAAQSLDSHPPQLLLARSRDLA